MQTTLLLKADALSLFDIAKEEFSEEAFVVQSDEEFPVEHLLLCRETED